MSPPAIRTTALRKVYRAPAAPRRSPKGGGFAPPITGAPTTTAPDAPTEVVALVGLDLEVQRGEFFGLLGPNGAGKSTTLGILTTRVRPTAGQALVAGHDVVQQDVAVKQRIGVVPQRANPDRALDVADNLRFHAAYFGIGRSDASARAHRLLDELGIAGKLHARVDSLSGGELQRLMIARALIHEPQVIFLDEPTVGLDPQARLALWDILRALHRAGRTIVMTTHYMEEADRLCQRLAIVDQGRLLALDTPAGLKARAPGGTLIELTLDGDAGGVTAAARALPGIASAEAQGAVLRTYTERGGDMIPSLIKVAERAGHAVLDIRLSPPSLETLFIALTGRKLT